MRSMRKGVFRSMRSRRPPGWAIAVVSLIAVAVGSLLLAPETPAETNSGSCLKMALRSPRVTEAEMIHPGDHYSQAIYAEFKTRPLTPECFQHVDTPRPEYQFQLQDALDHARWIKLDPFEMAGISRLHNDPRLDARWFGEGRKAPDGLKIPINRRKLYMCSPGPSVTRVRMVLRLIAINTATTRRVVQKVTLPVKVKTVDAPLKHRGALRGAC
jgi:hypothetical protein